MDDDQARRIRVLQTSMEEAARPAFDDRDIEDLRILVRLTVDFYDYLNSAPPWPKFGDGPLHNLRYVLDSVFINIESFSKVMRIYCILVGSRTTTIDWTAVNILDLKGQFMATYDAFVKERNFEHQCRLLLDLLKLQIVFAGASYDCIH